MLWPSEKFNHTNLAETIGKIMNLVQYCDGKYCIKKKKQSFCSQIAFCIRHSIAFVKSWGTSYYLQLYFYVKLHWYLFYSNKTHMYKTWYKSTKKYWQLAFLFLSFYFNISRSISMNLLKSSDTCSRGIFHSHTPSSNVFIVFLFLYK